MSLLHVALFKVDIHQLLEPYTKRLGGTKNIPLNSQTHVAIFGWAGILNSKCRL